MAEAVMNSSVFRTAVASGAILLASIGGASATIVNAEFTGFVASGIDGLALFGPAGANLTDLPFTVDFLYSTDLGIFFQTLTQNDLEGGPSINGAVSPVLKTSLTINAHTFTDIPLNSQVIAANGDPSLGNQDSYLTQDASGNEFTFDFISPTTHGDIPLTIDTPFTFTNVVDTAFGSVALGSQLPSDMLTLTPVTLTLTLPTVPEPSTWAMMLLGVAGLNLLGRRVRHWSAASLSSD
jgi:PEP-CTERM motif